MSVTKNDEEKDKSRYEENDRELWTSKLVTDAQSLTTFAVERISSFNINLLDLN